MLKSKTEEEYLSKQDKSYIRRYEKLMASPEAKARLIGKSWDWYYVKCLKNVAYATRYIYVRYFLMFLIWLDKNTDQLYQMMKNMQDDDDPREADTMQQIVSDFQDWYVETRGTTYAVADNIFCAVKGFFKANKLNFEYFDRGKWEPKPIAYMSLDHVREILNVTGSLKVKAYLLLAKDSGMRISDLVALKIGKIRQVLDDPDMQFFTFQIRVIKTGLLADPVIGPDAINSLRKWMDYRVNILGISANDDDFVFCSEKNMKGHIDKNGMEVTDVVKGGMLDSSCLSTNISRLIIKARLKPAPGEDKLPSVHSSIKLHATNLLDGGCPEAWINKMKGRKGVGTFGKYQRPPPEKLIARYRLAYPALSLTETVKDNETQELRHKLNVAEHKLEQLTEIPGFDKIMDRLDSMQNQIDNMPIG